MLILISISVKGLFCLPEATIAGNFGIIIQTITIKEGG